MSRKFGVSQIMIVVLRIRMAFISGSDFPKTICNVLIGLSDIIDEYKTKPDDVRFCLLLDKIKLVLSTATGLARLNVLRLFVPSLVTEGDLVDRTTKALKNIHSEIDDLEKYILGKRQTDFKQISDKLDDVLLGPDYPEGQRMMKRAKLDFEQHSTVEVVKPAQ